MIDYLDIGPNQIRVACYIFNEEAHTQWYLDEYNAKVPLQTAFYNLVHLGGDTNIANSLNVVADEVFTGERGDRKEEPNVAIVITDGISNWDESVVEESAAKLHQKATVIAVGIGSIQRKKLEVVASNPQDVITVANMDQLVDQLNNIILLVCPTSTTTRATTTQPPSTTKPTISTRSSTTQPVSTTPTSTTLPTTSTHASTTQPVSTKPGTTTQPSPSTKSTTQGFTIKQITTPTTTGRYM